MLESFANSDEVRAKYEKDIQKLRHQEENIREIRDTLKKDLCPKFYNVIGIFGSYRHIFSDSVNGSDAIDYIANKIAKSNPGCLVITGRYHYVFSNKKDAIIRESNLQSTLEDFVKEQEITSMGYSQIIASICNMAIFIMTQKRSTSAFEEVEFCKNLFEHNLIGLAVYILDFETEISGIQCNCYSFKDVKVDGLHYFVCDEIRDNFEPMCKSHVHDIPHSTIEIFMQRTFGCFVITCSWQQVPDIFEHIKISKPN
ncbi:MAG: hypothetical protein HYZ54_07205 [Ignavibacteriae bacterium]|nr:hypothetical protein [Ignavibacteriota bacterium]